MPLRCTWASLLIIDLLFMFTELHLATRAVRALGLLCVCLQFRLWFSYDPPMVLPVNTHRACSRPFYRRAICIIASLCPPLTRLGAIYHTSAPCSRFDVCVRRRFDDDGAEKWPGLFRKVGSFLAQCISVPGFGIPVFPFLLSWTSIPPIPMCSIQPSG